MWFNFSAIGFVESFKSQKKTNKYSVNCNFPSSAFFVTNQVSVLYFSMAY